MIFVSKVPRALETKTKLFGFELADVLIIFLYMSVSNLVFGQTHLKFLLVWVGTLALALTLYFAKKGKPDDHLQHLGEFYRTPEILSPSSPDLQYQPYFKSEQMEKRK